MQDDLDGLAGSGQLDTLVDIIQRKDVSDEEVLARLGTAIGHEISHAFDRTGAKFDKDGNEAKGDKKE